MDKVKKTIFFISYYFPPLGHSGAKRAFLLAKDMRQKGYDSLILTTEVKKTERIKKYDDSTLVGFDSEIVRLKNWMPCNNCGNGLIPRIIRRIWYEISFPDHAILWVLCAFKKTKEIANKQAIDLIFITGAPFSSFLIGYWIKKTLPIPVIIDYRDPWTGDRYYQNRKWKHYFVRKLEYKIANRVDRISVVTEGMAKFVYENLNRDKQLLEWKKFLSLPYYFETRPDNYIKNDYKRMSKLDIAFAGSSFGVADPTPLINSLIILRESEPDIFKSIKVQSIGDLTNGYEKLIVKAGLEDVFLINDFMPYEQVIYELKKADALLLPYKDVLHMTLCLPVKTLDYFMLQKPILYYGPQGFLCDEIIKSNMGFCSSPLDIKGIANNIKEIYRIVNLGGKFEINHKYLKKYSKQRVISQFAHSVNGLIIGHKSKPNIKHIAKES